MNTSLLPKKFLVATTLLGIILCIFALEVENYSDGFDNYALEDGALSMWLLMLCALQAFMFWKSIDLLNPPRWRPILSIVQGLLLAQTLQIQGLDFLETLPVAGALGISPLLFSLFLKQSPYTNAERVIGLIPLIALVLILLFAVLVSLLDDVSVPTSLQAFVLFYPTCLALIVSYIYLRDSNWYIRAASFAAIVAFMSVLASSDSENLGAFAAFALAPGLLLAFMMARAIESMIFGNTELGSTEQPLHKMKGTDRTAQVATAQLISDSALFEERLMILGKGNDYERAFIVQQLRERSQRIELINAGLLFAVFLVLVTGAFFVVFAGKITGRDTLSADHIDSLSRAQSNFDALLVQRADHAASVLEYQQNLEMLNAARHDQPQVQTKANFTQEEYNETSLELKRHTERLAALDESIAMSREVLASLTEATQNNSDGNPESEQPDNIISATNVLLSTQITRFGVLAIIIYLVQILLNVYRYNARLAGFYHARGDSLMLKDIDSDDIASLTTVFSPIFDFGKPPNSIPEKITDRASSMAEKMFDSTIRMTSSKAPDSEDKGSSKV